MEESADEHGMIDVTGGRVWYERIGAGSEMPLLTLHGGPGFPHSSLAPLADLGDRRPVLFYDQLGCGKSERPDDTGLWEIPRFVEEVRQVLDALELERVSILGHSWGTMLAVDFYLAYPERVQSLILASPMLSASRWKQDGQRLIEELPPDHREVIARHDAGEPHDKEAFDRAEKEYLRRHFCRLDPWPDEMKQAASEFGADAYHTMWGYCEWNPTGRLASYERAELLSDIHVPVLLTCGRYDEATPDTTSHYSEQIPSASMRVFDNCSHVAHFEDRENFLPAVRKFLDSG